MLLLLVFLMLLLLLLLLLLLCHNKAIIAQDAHLSCFRSLWFHQASAAFAAASHCSCYVVLVLLFLLLLLLRLLLLLVCSWCFVSLVVLLLLLLEFISVACVVVRPCSFRDWMVCSQHKLECPVLQTKDALSEYKWDWQTGMSCTCWSQPHA